MEMNVSVCRGADSWSSSCRCTLNLNRQRPSSRLIHFLGSAVVWPLAYRAAVRRYCAITSRLTLGGIHLTISADPREYITVQTVLGWTLCGFRLDLSSLVALTTGAGGVPEERRLAVCELRHPTLPELTTTVA